MRDKTNYSETFAGKVTVCPADRTGALAKDAAKTHAVAVRAMNMTSYTELRMREAENRISCDHNEATEPHSCPYQEEINDNHDLEFCTCCSECESQCAADIESERMMLHGEL